MSNTINVRGTPFTVPAQWSNNAAYICATKYARVVNGVKENSAEAICSRIAGALYPANRGMYSYLLRGMLNQEFAFNSPVWFNLGTRPDPQTSACFILGVEDNFESITNWWKTQTFVFKHGSGIGTDLSNIREKGASIGTDGIASGPLSFARVADAIGSATRSGGITRRAATMLTLRDWHPDVLEFVGVKARAEKLIRRLGEAGLDVSSLNSEVYEVISHQQANRAVRLSDGFMAAVEGDEIWELFSPKYPHDVRHTLPARELLRLIAQACWECGDPGIQFHDTIQRWHTLPNVGPINSSNPCSEYMSIDNSACNLASINLAKFWGECPTGVGEGKHFFLGHLSRTVTALVAAQDKLIDISTYPTEQIAANVRKYRQLGLGIANAGGLLMAMGIPYDSEEGRSIIAALMGIVTLEGYVESMTLEDGMSCFQEDEVNAVAVREVILKHVTAAESLVTRLRGYAPKDYLTALADYLLVVADGCTTLLMDGYLPRNSQISVVAPTGTISFVMDCATTGIEPAYSLIYEKELVADGARMVVPLNCVEDGLISLGYSEFDRQLILGTLPHRGSMRGLVRDEDLPVFATAVDPLSNTLSAEGHVKMLAAVQPFVSGAISKTVNLPHNATVADFERMIKFAHRKGLKALTFYRQGSKSAEPHKMMESYYCNACGGAMVQSGTCWTCPSCGEGGVCS